MKKIIYAVGEGIETAKESWFFTRTLVRIKLTEEMVKNSFNNLIYFLTEAEAESYGLSQLKYSRLNEVINARVVFGVEIVVPSDFSKSFTEFTIARVVTAKVLDDNFIQTKHRKEKMNLNSFKLTAPFELQQTKKAFYFFWQQPKYVCNNENYKGDFSKLHNKALEPVRFLNTMKKVNQNRVILQQAPIPIDIVKLICREYIMKNP